MDENLHDELLRVKARESRYKKEAESRIAELEAALQKARERGEAADSSAAQLLEAEAVIAAHKRDLEEAANREKSLRDQIALILKEAAKEKENGDREIGELKKQLSAARQKMSDGEKNAKKEQEAVAKNLQDKICALTKELDQIRAAKKAMAASVDAAAAERVKLEQELERIREKMGEIGELAAINLAMGKEDANTANFVNTLNTLAEVAKVQLSSLKEISDKISAKGPWGVNLKALNITGGELVTLLEPVESMAAAQKTIVDRFCDQCKMLRLAVNFLRENRRSRALDVEKLAGIENLLGKLKVRSDEIYGGIDALHNRANAFKETLLTTVGRAVMAEMVEKIEKSCKELLYVINPYIWKATKKD